MSQVAEGDGNGWVQCRCGHRHWGVHGAAGLLMVRRSRTSAPTAGEEVLLQLRAHWTHQGGTWALPGGAADSHESTATAALREAHEETGVQHADLDVVGEVVGTDHGDWSYTVVLARARASAAPRVANGESDEVRWVAVGDVDTLPLHPAFARSWPTVLAALDGALGAA